MSSADVVDESFGVQLEYAKLELAEVIGPARNEPVMVVRRIKIRGRTDHLTI